MQAKPLHDGLTVPKAGFTRIAIAGGIIITGEGDGTVNCHTVSNFQRAPPVWSRNVHDGQVTAVAMCKALDCAFSCGRDGKVMMTPNASSSQPGAPVPIMAVTGELNAIHVTPDGRRVYVAGDSVRCFLLDTAKICTIPITVPHPIVNVTVSADGHYVAMASHDGSVGVVTYTPDGHAPAPYSIRAMLPRIIPTRRGGAHEPTALRMSWGCNTHKDNVNALYLPTSNGIEVYTVVEDMAARLGGVDGSAAAAPAKSGGAPLGRLHQLASIAVPAMDPLAITIGNYASKYKSDVVVAGAKTNRILNYRLDESSSKHVKEVVQLAMEVSREEGTKGGEGSVAVFDVCVDPYTGTVAAVDSCGVLTIQKQFAVGVLGKAASSAKAAAASKVADHDDDEAAALKGETQLIIGGVSQSQTQPPSASRGVQSIGGSSKPYHNTTTAAGADDDDDAANPLTARDHLITHTEDVKAEDTAQVVKDLIKSNPSYIEDLATLKRKEKDRRGRAEAEAKQRVRQNVPSFVDDEAEEGSSEDNVDAEAHPVEEGSESDDDPHAEARMVDEMYRKRYNLGSRKKRRGDDDEDEDGDDADDGNGYGDDYAQQHHPNNSGHQQMMPTYAAAPIRNLYSFQPGSTPATIIHTDNGPAASPARYLALNAIGALRCAADNNVFAQFHDMTRTTVKITEKRTVLMGAMGVMGFALGLVAPTTAQQQQAEGKEAAARHIIFYRPYKPIALLNEWSIALQPGERIYNIAVGTRYVAVFTSLYLRVFSLSGLETAVISFPHHVVTVTGYNSLPHAATNLTVDPMAIAYVDGAGDMHVKVVDVANDGAEMVPATPLPLTYVTEEEQATLQWLGWSDEGVLHAVDSSGVTRRLHQQWGRSWVPVYDPSHRLTTDERFWVWGATASTLLSYRCIGDEQFPTAGDELPPVERVAVCLPLLRHNGDKAMLVREGYLRDYIRLQDVKAVVPVYDETLAGRDALLDRELMKQFVQSTQDGKLARAVDIATMFQLLGTMEEAARYANDQQERAVTERLLNEISRRKKLKKRRLCTLPLASDVGDKDRDRILKRLLEAEKSGQLLPMAVAAPTAVPAGARPPAPAQTNLLASPPKVVDAPTAHQQQQPPAESPQRTPQSKRVVFDDPAPSIATVGGQSPAASSSMPAPNRSLLGVMDAAAPTPATPATPADAAPTPNTATRKPFNPFGSKPATSPATPASAVGAPNSGAVSAVAPPAGAPTKPATPFAKNTAIHQPTTPPASTTPAMVSASATKPSPFNKAPGSAATTAPPTGSPAKKLSRTEVPDGEGTTAVTAVATGITPMRSATTTASSSSTGAQKLSISKSNTFAVAPINVDATQQYGVGVSAPTFQNVVSDPFAALTSYNNEASMTEAVGLMDMGHLGSQAAAPSLMAALKRQRDDEDDEDDDGPAISLAL